MHIRYSFLKEVLDASLARLWRMLSRENCWLWYQVRVGPTGDNDKSSWAVTRVIELTHIWVKSGTLGDKEEAREVVAQSYWDQSAATAVLKMPWELTGLAHAVSCGHLGAIACFLEVQGLKECCCRSSFTLGLVFGSIRRISAFPVSRIFFLVTCHKERFPTEKTCWINT